MPDSVRETVARALRDNIYIASDDDGGGLEGIADATDAILAALPGQAEIDRLRRHLSGLLDAYKLVCDELGKPYYESPSSKYAAAMRELNSPSPPQTTQPGERG